MILTPLTRSCFIWRLDFGNHANVLNLEAQPIDSGTVSYHRLMALGLVATVTVIMRLVKMLTLDFASPERFRTPIPVYFWLRMEEAILIIASSAPMLKSPIEHVLHKFGLPMFQPRVRELTSFHFSNPVSDTTPRLHHQRSQQELLGYEQHIFMHEPRLEGAEDPPLISNDMQPLSDIPQALTR
jgi:hypothetical protein